MPSCWRQRCCNRDLASPRKVGGGKFTLSGTVKGDGQPLVGATVVEPGTSNGTVTGADGKFSLSLSKRGASIQVSFIGYVTKTLTANADFLEVALDSDAQKIDEVMVVAYGTMRKRDVTGSITSISSESIERRAPANVFEALQGQVAGVQISAGSGQPGESSQINIRGISTFSAEGVKPLYVVDGIPMEDIDGINPGDITSIEVLKDAASAAMYGSRSANGVILITTKGGQEGAPRIDVKYLHTWGKLSHKLAQATRADRRKFDILRDTYHKDNATGYVDNASNQLINDSLNAAFNVDNDYQDLLFQWAQKDQVDLSVAGGTKRMKYFGSTGYYNERGIVPNTNFQRLTARINADYTAANWLTLHSRVSLGYSQKNGINEGQLMTAMLSRRPYFNLYYPDGTLAGVFQGQKSPLAQVKYTTDRTEYYQGNLYQGFELKLAKGLTFQTSINANLYLNKRQRVYPSMITDEWQKSNSGYAADNLNWNWLNENVLTYKNKWGNHNFSALVGFSEQQWRTDQTVLSGINSSTDFIPTMNAFAANLTLNETGTWQSNHSMASLFARVTYDFKAKYLIQATFRRDGSSRFSKGNRWGNFPSVSAAWRLSDENFMSFSRRALDDAKIRVSWGITGNEQIGNYDYLYSYATGDIYDGVGGAVDYWFVYGGDPAGCVRGYRALTGAASMLPKWAFGFWQSRERYKSFDELTRVVSEYRRRHIPIDIIVQDWEYWGEKPRWNALQWDSVRYPNPGAAVARLHEEYGVRLLVSVWPGFGPETAVYRDLEAAGVLFDERTWAGYKVFDAYDPAARDIFWRHFRTGLFDTGIDGWWMDATEPSFREGFTQRKQEARTKSAGKTHLGAFHRYLNTYSLVWTGDLYGRLRAAAPERRPLLFTRSAFAGQQRYGTAVWSGDIVASWETMKRQLAAGVNLAASGFPYWTFDTGGFYVTDNGGIYPRGLADPAYKELYARWFQFGAFLPIFRAHGTNVPREVWQFGDERSVWYRNQIEYIDLRYRLTPYVYSTAYDVAANGSSFIAAAGMAFPEDRAVAAYDEAYLFGPALLVRPVFEPMPAGARTQPVTTLLPRHDGAWWYDFFTGEAFRGGERITRACGLTELPVYARGGSIVPTGAAKESVMAGPDTELEIRVYTGADARFTLYDDAGDGYGYEQGEYARCTLGWSEADAALRISAREGSYPGMAQEQTLRIRVFRPGAEPAEQTVRYTGEPLECKFQLTENR